MLSRNLNKTLIALAAMAAVGAAQADSSFQITGLLDAGVKITDVSNDTTKNKTELTNNNTATSQVYLKGFRDIGDSMKAAFLLEMDFNPAANSTLNTNNTNGQAWSGTPFNGEEFIQLTGGFGDIKLGMPNSAGLTAGVTAQPFGTALGGGFSGAFGRLGTASISGVNSFDTGTTGRIIRHEKTIMYATPVFAGFKATAEYAFGNDAAIPTTSGTTTTSNVWNNSNTNAGVSLQYNAGPINAIYYYGNEKAGAMGAAGATSAIGVAPSIGLAAGTDVTWNMVAANYTMGAFTVMGGYTTTKHNAKVALEDSSSWNIAGKYVLSPSWEFLGNYLVRDTNLSNQYDATLIGLGANYYLDKQTNVYARYEGINFNNKPGAANFDQTIWALGVRYQF